MKLRNTILLAGFIAGTLDAIGAILLYANPINLENSSKIFRSIAGVLFGGSAYTAGIFYPLLGLLIHYFIATVWSILYFIVFFRVFKTGSIWAKTVFLACLIWIIMNGYVLPIAGLKAHYDGWAIMRSFTVILVCVSLPVCLIGELRKKKS
jgi:hypothetical protein